MSGNYGGSSTPTYPIGGDVLFGGRNTTYKDWMCTSIVATAATAHFSIGGVQYDVDMGAVIDLVVSPDTLGVIAPLGVYFLCYACSCSSPFSGITTPSPVNYSGTSAMMRPVIIGGGGLNS